MSPRHHALLAVVLAALLLMAAALYNGYPLTFWDTRAYIEHAVSLLPRPDRLIGYSIFVRLLGAKLTLWPVIVAQCLLVAWLVRRALQVMLERVTTMGFLLLIGALTLASALPWIAGQLMADIFTPLLVLALWILVRAPTLHRFERSALLVLVALCVCVHLTHFPIGLGLLLVAASAQRSSARLMAPALALLLGLCTITGFNYARSGRVTLASGSDAFILGHLVESGIASRVLDEHCGTNAPKQPSRDYLLCPHRSKLPLSVDEFLWVDVLDLEPWKRPAPIAKEAHRLLRDSLLEHPWLHLQVALSYTTRVLLRFATGEGLDSDAQLVIEPQIARFAPGDLPAYRAARQQRDAVPVALLRSIHTPLGWLMLALSLLLLARGAFRGALPQDASLHFLLFVFAALFFNAAISGNMSGIYDRYESRLVWLLALGLYAFMETRRRALPHKTQAAPLHARP